jgi:hypothetical protein
MELNTNGCLNSAPGGGFATANVIGQMAEATNISLKTKQRGCAYNTPNAIEKSTIEPSN